MTGNNISDRILERYLLNELPGEQIRELNSRIELDETLKQRVEELRASNNEILNQHPPESVLPGILNRSRILELENENEAAEISTPLWRKRLVFASPLMAAALVIVFMMLPVERPGTGTISENPEYIGETRIKGNQTIDMSKPNLLVYRKLKLQAELLKEGVIVRSGDPASIGLYRS